MITVTLTFKSIEAARAALLEIPSSSLVGDATDVPKKADKKVVPGIALESGEFIPADKIPAGKQLRQPNNPDDKSQITSAGTAGVLEDKPDPKLVATTSSEKPSESVEYPVLQKAVFALASKSREKAAAVAASFGVKTFKELSEDKWFAALTAVNAALEEVA